MQKDLYTKWWRGKGRKDLFFSAKRGGECKTATTKADSKNYNATTKADSNTFTLPHFFLFLFAHNFLALFTHIQTGKQTDRQSDHQEFCRNKQIPSDCGGAWPHQQITWLIMKLKSHFFTLSLVSDLSHNSHRSPGWFFFLKAHKNSGWTPTYTVCACAWIEITKKKYLKSSVTVKTTFTCTMYRMPLHAVKALSQFPTYMNIHTSVKFQRSTSPLSQTENTCICFFWRDKSYHNYVRQHHLHKYKEW